MMEPEPTKMFRGLPLTPEQDSEIRHYIHVRQRSGLPWDTPELQAMVEDMLDPPEAEEEDRQSLDGSLGKERAASILDGGADHDTSDPASES
jgi:hypothetical protein